MDETVIAGKHKGVDQNAGAFALCHFLERLSNHERVEPEGILVNAAVLERQCRGLAIRNHDDLAHVLLLSRQNSLRQTQSFARIGVVRSHLHARQFAERNFLRAVMKQHAVQRIARILRANQV